MAQEQDQKEMSFLDHLEELRWHIIRSFAAIFIIAVLVFLSSGFIFDTLFFGPTKASFPTLRALCYLSNAVGLGERLCMGDLSFSFINTEVAGQFLIHLKTSLVLGFVIAFPYVLYEIWKFISPGLYAEERKHASGAVFFATALFFTGVSFGYLVLSPFSLSFFGRYLVSGMVENTITLTNYVAFLTMMVLASGFIFELPMIVYFLSRIGLLTPDMMREYRRHAVIVLLILAAIITPPDIGTQVLIGLPLYLLYEISILISARVVRNLEKNPV